MSELAAEIDKLVEEGCPPYIIAETLNIPAEMVLLYVEGKHSVPKPSFLEFDDDIPF
jgi:hypothetical protein